MDLHIRGEIRAYFKHSIEYGLENLKTSRHVEKYDEAPRHVEKIWPCTPTWSCVVFSLKNSLPSQRLEFTSWYRKIAISGKNVLLQKILGFPCWWKTGRRPQWRTAFPTNASSNEAQTKGTGKTSQTTPTSKGTADSFRWQSELICKFLWKMIMSTMSNSLVPISNSSSFQLGCLSKNPMAIRTSEVAHTEQAAIMGSNLLIHLHSNPFLREKKTHHSKFFKTFLFYTLRIFCATFSCR